MHTYIYVHTYIHTYMQRGPKYSLYLLYWYESTNTEAKAKKDRARAEGSEGLGSDFACFTSTTVQLLTPATPGRPEYVPATYADGC
jgi:hypothetical protein